MYGVVEQLFQDLNSYCESFIDLPEAYHTKDTVPHEDTGRIVGSPSMHLRGTPSFSAFSGSLSRAGSFRNHREATRKLSAATESAISQSSSRRQSIIEGNKSNLTGPVNLLSEGSPGSASFDLAGHTLAMSPIAETSKTRMTPASVQTSHSVSAKQKESRAHIPANNVETGPVAESRRSSSSSILEARRPSLPRSKTLATAAISEAKASASTGPTALGPKPSAMQRTVSASSNASSSTASAPRHEPMAMLRSSSAESTFGKHEGNGVFEGLTAELSSSLLSLRNIAATGADGTATSAASLRESGGLNLASAPLPRPSGQREPPHGLGRKVREAINLKLFPTYANPPPVNDWDVPISLLNLGRDRSAPGGIDWSSDWDLTMASVYPYVNGINHVKRIAQLADADLELTRQCMEHLLYYGCIIMVDVFQFFNIYALKPSIASLADDPSIQAECGSYVTRPGYAIPPWPTLLSLYTALRPGIVLDQWIEERDVEAMGVDVRRFITFGVIKGFIRRVHRYPVLLGGPEPLVGLLQQAMDSGRHLSEPQRRLSDWTNPKNRSDGDTFSAPLPTPVPFSPASARHRRDDSEEGERPSSARRQASETASLRTLRPSSAQGMRGSHEDLSARSPPYKTSQSSRHAGHPDAGRQHANWYASRASARPSRYTTATVADAANIAFETVESRPRPTSRAGNSSGMNQRSTTVVYPSAGQGNPSTPGRAGSSSHISRGLGQSENDASNRGLLDTPTKQGGQKQLDALRKRRAASGTSSVMDQSGATPLPNELNLSFIPPELPYMLDGTHCEDEICVHLGLSWSQLRRLLLRIGKFVTHSSQSHRRRSRTPQRGPLHQQSNGKATKASQSQASTGDPNTSLDDWLPETPAFGNVSGFAGHSGILDPGSAIGPSAAGGKESTWTLPGLSGRLATSRPSFGSTVVAGSQMRHRGDPSSADTFGSFMPKSLAQALDVLEVEDNEDALEKTGDFGGIVLLSI